MAKSGRQRHKEWRERHRNDRKMNLLLEKKIAEKWDELRKKYGLTNQKLFERAIESLYSQMKSGVVRRNQK